MSTGPMPIHVFVQECKDDAESFYQYWLAERQKRPSDFPLQMNPGDWFDQYLAFLSIHGKGSA